MNTETGAPLPVKQSLKIKKIILIVFISLLAATIIATIVLVLTTKPNASNSGNAGNEPNASKVVEVDKTIENKETVEDVISLAGSSFACDIKIATGEVTCFGGNNYGQLGTGAASGEAKYSFKSNIENIKYAVAGLDHACIASNEKLMCWGDNRWGQAAHSDVKLLPPTLIPLPGENLTSLSAGDIHTCFVSDEAAYCFGSDFSGQLTGTKGEKAKGITKIQLPEGKSVKTVNALDFATCITSSEDKTYCQGANNNKRLMDSDQEILQQTLMGK